MQVTITVLPLTTVSEVNNILNVHVLHMYAVLHLSTITYTCKGNSHNAMITVQSTTTLLRSTVDYHLIKV